MLVRILIGLLIGFVANTIATAIVGYQSVFFWLLLQIVFSVVGIYLYDKFVSTPVEE